MQTGENDEISCWLIHFWQTRIIVFPFLRSSRIPFDRSEKRQLLAEFRKEARRARSQLRESLVMEWHETYPSMGDKENQLVDRYSGTTGLSDSGFYDDEFAFDHFVSVRMESYDRWAEERKTTFLSSLKSRPPTPTLGQAGRSAQLRQERTQALWEGLRRQFFGETEFGPVLADAPGTRGGEDDDTRVPLLREEISALMEQLQRRQVRFPTNSPSPLLGLNEFDPDDSPPDQTLALCQQPPSDVSSSPPVLKGSPGPRRSNRIKPTPPKVPAPVRSKANDRWYFEPVPLIDTIVGGEVSLSNQAVFLAQGSSDAASTECQSLVPKVHALHGLSLANQDGSFSQDPDKSQRSPFDQTKWKDRLPISMTMRSGELLTSLFMARAFVMFHKQWVLMSLLSSRGCRKQARFSVSRHFPIRLGLRHSYRSCPGSSERRECAQPARIDA